MKKLILGLSISTAVVGIYLSRGIIRSNYMPIRSMLAQLGLLGYKEVSCPTGGIEIGVFGQSNSANSVRPLISEKFPTNLYQYDWIANKCYEYKEPLLGAQGLGGNVVSYTASRIASNTSRPVLVIPFGLGGTSVLQWAYGSAVSQQNTALKNMKTNNISPDIFLWHQGESDNGLSRDRYSKALQTVLSRTRDFFPNSYFGIALASRCGKNGQWEPVRQAQKEVAYKNKKAFISADSDSIYGEKSRFDNCHFSDTGAKELGRRYYSNISNAVQ